MQFLINQMYTNTNLRYETQSPLNKNTIIKNNNNKNFNIHLSAIINTDTDSLENA